MGAGPSQTDPQSLDAVPPGRGEAHPVPLIVGEPRTDPSSADWQIEALASDAAIVATELVTNAVQHARTSTRLTQRIDDATLHVAVRDHHVADDATQQRLRTAPVSGHGLHIVAAICRTRCRDLPDPRDDITHRRQDRLGGDRPRLGGTARLVTTTGVLQ